MTNALLARSVISANARLRRKEGISAYELHTARSQDTGSNLQLDDMKLFEQQQTARQSASTSDKPQEIKVGDTVTPISGQPKHHARDIFMVTGVEADRVSAQKILHPLSQTPVKLMGRPYTGHTKHLQLVHSPPSTLTASPSEQEVSVQSTLSRSPSSDYITGQSPNRRSLWSPVNEDFYNEESTDDNDDDDDCGQGRNLEIYIHGFSESESEQEAQSEHSQEGSEPHSPQAPQLPTTPPGLFQPTPPAIQEPEPEPQAAGQEDAGLITPQPRVLVTTPRELFPQAQFLIDLEPGDMAEAETAVEHNLDEVEEAVVEDAAMAVQHQEADQQEDDPHAHLRGFHYRQGRQPRKGDSLYYYDSEYNDFLRVSVFSRSNYRYYYNVRYLDIERPDGGVYLRPGEFWSYDYPLPVHQPEIQEPVPDQPIEQERRGAARPRSRQISPWQSDEQLRSGQVYSLPPSESLDSLSPLTRQRARRLALPPEQEFMRASLARALAPPPPQKKLSEFLDKVFPKRK